MKKAVANIASREIGLLTTNQFDVPEGSNCGETDPRGGVELANTQPCIKNKSQTTVTLADKKDSY